MMVAAVSFARWSRTASQHNFFENSDQFILYSTSPWKGLSKEMGQNNPNAEQFYRREVLGKIVITDSTEKATLINALFNSLGRGTEAECHNPRHGIRAVRGDRTVDATVCFDCGNTQFYSNGVKILHTSMSREAQELFNQTLRKHHLPLAKE